MISKISNKAAVVARVWMLFFHKNKLYGSRNILVYHTIFSKTSPFRYKTLCLNKKSHKRAAITIVVFVSGLFISLHSYVYVSFLFVILDHLQNNYFHQNLCQLSSHFH